MRGHDVFYCTRQEDLPDSGSEDGSSRKAVTEVKGTNYPPGDLKRLSKPLESALISSPSGAGGATLSGRAEPPHKSDKSTSGLASAGGVLGSAGNPLSFTDTHELHSIVRYVDPDLILVEAPEEVRRLPPGTFRVVLDLFAPRILEQQFQEGAGEREGVRVLDALQLADAVVFSNERQKYYHLPLLALAGIDCTQSAGVVVPISGPSEQPTFAKPKAPIFVAGGVFWPWADLGPGLARLHSCLKEAKRGKIHLYGGEYGIRSDTQSYADPRQSLPKKSKHLSFKGMVPIDTLWKEYSKASVAFDLMTPNPEREINLSFRQIDYLRCGLPIITSPRQVIAEQLLEYGAGWCVEPGDDKALDKLVGDLLAHPEKIAKASSAAQKLAKEHFTWESATAPLDTLVRGLKKREHKETFVNRLTRTQGDLWQEHEENKRLRETVIHLQDDQEKKSEELQKLNARLGVLLGSVDRLSGSLTAVSRFKNDALLFLHEQEDAALREAAELATEVERLQLDIKKKDAAIKAGKRELSKAARALAKQEELVAAELEKKDKEASIAAKEAKSELEQRDKALARQEDLFQSELEKKNKELTGLQRELRAVQLAASSASAKQDELLEAELNKKDKDIAAAAKEAKAELAKAAKALARQEARLAEEIEKKDKEAATAAKEAHAELTKAEKDHARQEDLLKAELGKKDRELTRLQRELRGEQLAAAAAAAKQDELLEAELNKKDKDIAAAAKEAKAELAKAAKSLALQEARLAEELEKKDKEASTAAKEALAELKKTAKAHARQEDLLRAELGKKDKELTELRRELRAEQSAATAALANQEALFEAELSKKDNDFAAAAKEAKAELSKAGKAQARQEARLSQELEKKDKDIASLGLELQKTQAAGERALAQQDRQYAAALEKKDEETARLGEERALLQKRLDRALEESQKKNDALAEGKVTISDLEGRNNLAENQVEAGRLEVERLKDRLQQSRFEYKKLMQELDKKEREVEKAQKTRDNTKAKLESAAKKLEERLAKAEFVERTLLEEAAKKDIEVNEAQVERDTMKAGLEASISSLEERLAKSEFEYRTLVEESAKKDGEIQELMTDRDNLQTRLLGDLQRVEADRERLVVKTGALEGRLEEIRFQVQVQQSEIEKKNDEIADAQARRDALAEALQEERAQQARGGVLLRRKLKSGFLGRSESE